MVVVHVEMRLAQDIQLAVYRANHLSDEIHLKAAVLGTITLKQSAGNIQLIGIVAINALGLVRSRAACKRVSAEVGVALELYRENVLYGVLLVNAEYIGIIVEQAIVAFVDYFLCLLRSLLPLFLSKIDFRQNCLCRARRCPSKVGSRIYRRQILGILQILLNLSVDLSLGCLNNVEMSGIKCRDFVKYQRHIAKPSHKIEVV